MTSTVYLGIDVAKEKLDFCTPQGEFGQVPNTPQGYRKLIKMMRLHQSVIAILEASGGYEQLAAQALRQAGMQVAIVQPGRVRAFAKAAGQLAKTDRIDAAVLLQFGQAMRPRITPAPTPEQKELRELVSRRSHLVEERKREKMRLQKATSTVIIRDIKGHLTELTRRIERLEDKMDTLKKNTPVFEKKAKVLCQVIGVADLTASVLLAELPELGQVGRHQIASLAGVAPFTRESGKWKGRSFTQGGRAAVRKALCTSAMSAVQHDPVLKAVYKRMLNAGKPKMVAQVACSRKLLVYLNGLMEKALRDGLLDSVADATA